jgi:putative transcriptional regulator
VFTYKIDIIKELSSRGFNATRIRKEKIISQATLQNIRQGKSITLDTLNTICIILRCQPSDVVEITPSNEEKIKYF